jgi:hypothetical protein
MTEIYKLASHQIKPLQNIRARIMTLVWQELAEAYQKVSISVETFFLGRVLEIPRWIDLVIVSPMGH